MMGPMSGTATISRDAIEQDPVFQEPWYHTIEVHPGLFTPGSDFRNIALTRAMLRGAAIEGRRCLDIGAMDCLVSLLLHRRGAAHVAAHDIQPRPTHVDFLRRVLGLEVSYHDEPLVELAGALRRAGLHPFDVVVFSGVLYHMFDPFAGLATVRGLVRTGGIVIVETSALVHDEHSAWFNAGGRFFPGTNYWQVTLPCLDYMLRFLRLAPLDCAWFEHPRSKHSPHPICRIAIACRATAEVLAEPGDQWMREKGETKHHRAFLDWRSVRSDAPEVPYAPATRGLVERPASGSIDLLATVRATKPLRLDDLENQVRLRLGATE